LVVSLALPQAASGITPVWLSDVLGREVTTVRADPIGPLAGVNSAVSRLHLEGPDGTSTLVFKVPAPSEGARSVAMFQRWYEREVGFYQQLAARTPLGTPAVLFAGIEPDGRYVLLLEDIRDVPQGDQIAGCTAEAARMVVLAAADMHAAFWNAVELEAFDWLPATTVGLERAEPVAGAFARSWSLRRDLADPALRPLVDRAAEAYPELLARAARPPFTLIHGDYRLDNMFLLPTGRGLRVIDWQFIARCRGVYDVAYFLGLNLDVEHRRAVEDELLTAYGERLAAAGIEYRRDDIDLDYRLALLLSYAVFAIGAAGQDPASRAGLMHEVGLERLGAAILDHGIGGVL
jgi:hypothetical protein